MKRTLLLLPLLAICITMRAEVMKFTAYEFSYKTHNDYYNTWTDWSRWEACNILVVINLSTDRINIYSSTTQEFDVIDSKDVYTDYDGDDVMEMDCIDADGVRCTIRVVIRQNGTIQLYCDYSNIMYVYNIRAKN